MSKSKINWVKDLHTASPIIGCSKCSPACQNCYALTMARRLAGMKGPVGDDYRLVIADGEWNGNTVFIPEVLDKIIKRKKPTTYFIGSMTDIFHEDVPLEWIHEIWDVMKRTPQHRYMILTKRPKRMNDIVGLIYRQESSGHAMGFWSHVAIGVSVWDQKSMDNALELLSKIPESHLFISAEPLLGPVIAAPDLIRRLSLVVVGGETGPKARPMHPDWARSLRDQCAAADVPFMLKSFGEWSENGFGILQKFEQMLWVRKSGGFSMPLKYWAGEKYDDSLLMHRVGKKAAGRTLDGVEHNGAIQWEVAR